MIPATTDYQRFREWESHVNGILIARIGVGLDDLPDQLTRDWYDDGITAKQAAAKILTRIYRGEL